MGAQVRVEARARVRGGDDGGGRAGGGGRRRAAAAALAALAAAAALAAVAAHPAASVLPSSPHAQPRTPEALSSVQSLGSDRPGCASCSRLTWLGLGPGLGLGRGLG